MRRRSLDPRVFDEFVHYTLRTPELARLPGGAKTVLSGGCAGTWYFEWFAEQYPTPIERHIGVDAYAAEPDDLPANVEWISSSLGDLSAVEDSLVDLVYAGQTIEHLWPEEVVGFLCEAHRLLHPDGRLALDSTNRRVTVTSDWNHPEHTVEFTPEEIVELLELAGFVDVQIRGLWLCYDRDHDRFLDLYELGETGSWSQRRRLDEGRSRPEDCFIWWVEAIRGGEAPDREMLEQEVSRIYEGYRRHRLGCLEHEVGRLESANGEQMITARRRKHGRLLFGPHVPMRAGRWTANFYLRAGPRQRRFRSRRPGSMDRVLPGALLGEVSVTAGYEKRIVAALDLSVDQIPVDGRLVEIGLPFELAATEFGVQFRLRSFGRLKMSALNRVDVLPSPLVPHGVGPGPADLAKARGV